MAQQMARLFVEEIANALQQTGLAVALQHPDILLSFRDGIDEALSIRSET